MASLQTSGEPPVSDNTRDDVSQATLESLVTAEQVHSANVARKRRNISKKRPSSVAKQRDPTPVRTAVDKETTDEEEPTPNAPERKQRRKSQAEKPEDKETISKEEKNEQNVQKCITDGNGKKTDEDVGLKEDQTIAVQEDVVKNDETVVPDVATSLCAEEDPAPVESVIDDQEEVIVVKKALKGTQQSEVFALLKQAKQSIAPKPKTRLKKGESNKRSMSTPREKTTTDDDLVESFKIAQISALQRDSILFDHTSSEEDRYPTMKLTHRRVSNQKTTKRKVSLETEPTVEMHPEDPPVTVDAKPTKLTIMEVYRQWKIFKLNNQEEYKKIRTLNSKCMSELLVMMIFCGLGGIMFKTTEGTFENFYKCGVKRVKRDFIDALWLNSHNLQEDRWKSVARTKLRTFEEELHAAHEAGMTSYSGQRSWSFLNGIVYALTVVTTIGYGHMYPTTHTGRALTIVYAIIGIPLFLIILTDFGKLFTRAIKFVWAFVRRLYYTGSCKKVRRTAPVQDFFKGAQMMYEIATFRRPSQWDGNNLENGQQNLPPNYGPRGPTSIDGSTPTTPAPSNYAIDDEFNLPISVAILMLLIYIFLGAVIFHMWEEWDFFTSFYFVFISMSTIGFGDYVPKHPLCILVSIIYLVFGLALMSMCINVVQLKLSDTFRQASAKIGATIGLTIADEDGTITPIPPPPVDIVEVHNAK